MRFNYLALVLFLFFISCSTNPYDTSTPEKFVASMGKIGEQSKDHNPLPYFYDKESADVILAFDQAAEKGLTSFDKFRNLMAEKFPKHTKTNREGMLRVTLDGSQGLDVRSFTYSASMIGPQLRERKPSDYKFVSIGEPNYEGAMELKVEISKREVTLPLKKTADGYRMFLPPRTLKDLGKSIPKIEKFDQIFSEGIRLIESGELTQENFEEKVRLLADQYFQAVR